MNKVSEKLITDYFAEGQKILSKISPQEVAALASAIEKVRVLGSTVYIAGNGGSASTASHFVNDLTIITKRRGVHVKAFSLVDSIATITAIGNDESFEDIYKTQLLNRLGEKDLVFSISASGNSFRENSLSYRLLLDDVIASVRHVVWLTRSALDCDSIRFLPRPWVIA